MTLKATRLTAAQCAAAIRDGEFGPEVREAAESVAVILTQGWCPQWKAMAAWLDAAAIEAGSAAFYVEYDEEDFFEPFMAWKEDVLGNRSVPYIRYYRGGALSGQGNYVSKGAFIAALRREAPTRA